METKLSKSTLVKLLSRVSHAASSKPQWPLLGCVHLSANGSVLTARATNTFLHASTTDEAASKVSGATAVPAKLLLASVANLPEGEVSLKLDKAKLILRGGKQRYSLPTMEASDFPPFPQRSGDVTLTIPAANLAGLLKTVQHAASTDETRANLAGINLEMAGEELSAVATDGHRLATATTEVSSGKLAQTLVPHHSINALVKLCDRSTENVSLAVGGGYLFATLGTSSLAVAIAQEQFPPWQKVVPSTHQHRVIVSRDAFVSAVKSVNVVVGDTGGVVMNFEEGRVSITAESSDNGDALAELDVDYAGGGLKIACNAAYLMDAINAFTSDEVALEMGDELSPIKVCAQAESTVTVCMPMRA